MSRWFLVALLCHVAVMGNAQTTTARQQYDEFRRKARQQYDDFRSKANQQYAEFLKKAWRMYNIQPAIPKPKDEDVPPVVMPEEDVTIPIKESKPVPIEEVVEPPVLSPQPVPVAPIREVPRPVEERAAFMFFGTECKVRFSAGCRFSLGDCGNESLAAVWQRLSGAEYNNLIRDCLELRVRMQLCDWAYLNLLNVMSKTFMERTSEAVFLAAYIYCQSGYKMRLGRVGDRLYLLYASNHSIYDMPYYTIDGDKYYVLDCNTSEMEICDVAYPKEQSLSLQIPQAQMLNTERTQARTLQSARYPEVKVSVSVNKNLIDFYDTYPSSEIGGNFMTRWAMYANVVLDADVKDKLYPALRERLKGLDEKEAAERLLNFVQTAFVYEYDDKVWGHDRAFFPEETLYYPYCDCEDRSILFSRLVRDLLGLDVLLVYYPGHLATAVCFKENVSGDYILLNGRRFTVCDPTYIGAGVGRTMPDMDNRGAKVILLED